MKRATVVVGSNWGDCGKGLLVDYFAGRSPWSGPTVCCRFNGGAQSGHTVVTPEGQRHVFSHFGAGTFTGGGGASHTYFAKHFVCNPILFWREAEKLKDIHRAVPLAADPRCFITTPYDMLINQLVEDARGKDRHGSVGVGFGETIERSQYPAFRLMKSDLGNRDTIKQKLRNIRNSWLPRRCQQLGIRRLDHGDKALSDHMLDRTVDAFVAFDNAVITAGAEFLEHKAIVFEGAQGLALDMDSGNFPHVTRSNTGLVNVVPLARVLGLSLEVVYASRCYLTKHGAGPLPGECKPDPRWGDSTNTPHPYQGELRFAPLDVPSMMERIHKDLKQAPLSQWSVALTCTDQVTPVVENEIADKIGKVRYRSTGPTRDHVHADKH